MIEIKNLTKRYQNNEVLKDINLEFEDKGLVMILGPSGSGKSTLLNCISTLTDYEGTIRINGKNYGPLEEDKKSEFRLHDIGFIFQDFKLFESDTVFNNVALPLNVIDVKKKDANLQEVLSTLKMCGVDTLKDNYVSDLSGGEKQRVAIARALVTKPKFLIADEPTGSLDKENAKVVMELLKTISQKKLVIMVTHDQSLVDTYPDQVVYLKDGEVEKVETYNYEIVTKSLLQAKKEAPENTGKLPSSFIRNHIKQYNKRKKWRTTLSKAVISLGLVGVGLAFVISECVSGIITSSYSQLIGEDQIIIDDTNFYNKFRDIQGLSYNSAKEYKSLYPEYISDIGVTYLNDYSYFFPDVNEFYLYGPAYKESVTNLTASSINDFIWLDEYTPSKVYPSLPETLEDDQVVLGLTISSIRSLDHLLDIAWTDGGTGIKPLSDYIKNSKEGLYIYLNVENNSWPAHKTQDGTYEDSILLQVVGFSFETTQDCIYHYNHLWNEYIFEEYMTFPSSLSINSPHSDKTTMEKVYYYETGGERDEFIDLLVNEKKLQNIFFDCASKNYFSHYSDYSDIYDNRIILYENNETYISPYIGNQILELDKNVDSIIYGTDMGYAIYGTYYMSGFARESYFSFDYDAVLDVVDQVSYYEYLENIKFSMPAGVLEGYYTLTSSEGVTFYPLDESLISIGKSPGCPDEIVVSTGLLTKLGMSVKSLPVRPLNFAYNYEETYQSDNFVRKSFKYSTLTVTGIIEDDRPIIYQYSPWIVTYFMSRFQVSSFSLIPHSISLTAKDASKIDSSLRLLKNYFPAFNVYSPLRDLSASVNEVTNYITIGILIFSIVAIIAAALLIFTTTNFLIVENKKEFGLLRCLGVNAKESFKLVIGYSLNLSLTSFLFSIVELVIVVLVVQLGFDALTFSLSFLWAIFTMFIVSIGISLLAAALNYKKIISLNPLDAIKR
ncbi:MAG: ATP-binding cassette domain-containing protein [Coprobacillus sp.]|nr:ATP-binding cassette domain-containing protein [Coprobacillus sp.]